MPLRLVDSVQDRPTARSRTRRAIAPFRPPTERASTDELAFVRALIEGVAWRAAARRYLFNEDISHPAIAALLRAWAQRIEQAAAAAGEPALAQRLPVRALLPPARAAGKVAADAALSFEQWLDSDAGALAQGLAPAAVRARYERYVDEHQAAGDRPPLLKWGPLERDLALAALARLQPQVARAPDPDHALGVWLAPRLVERCTKAGLRTIRELAAYMNRHGHSWYMRVPGIGKRRAAAMCRWLDQQPRTQGLLTPLATTPRTLLVTADLQAVREGRQAIVPFERIVLPVAVSGTDGTNRERRRRCQISAHNDRDAVERWLVATTTNGNTRRAYQREAERFLQWCVYEKGRALASAGTEDVIEYREFLVALAHAELPWPWRTQRSDWIGEKSHPRTSPNWRPFEGRMSRASIERALRIVRALFTWLVDCGYLAGNPWTGVRLDLASHEQLRAPATSYSARHVLDKALTASESSAVLAVIESLGTAEQAARARVVLLLGMHAGLRREEMANAVCGWLYRPAGADRLALRAIGKGGKTRELPVSAPLQAAIEQYLEQRGLPRDPLQCAADAPIIARLASEQLRSQDGRNGRSRHPEALTPARLYTLVQQYMRHAARELQWVDPLESRTEMRSRRRLGTLAGRAHPHALRHTFGTAAANKLPLAIVQALMDHADPSTTTGYYSPRTGAMFGEIDAVFGKG